MNGNVFRDPQSCMERRFDRAYGGEVVVAKDGVWPGLQFQQFLHRLKARNVSRLFSPIADNHTILGRGKRGRRQCASIAAQSVERRAGILPANVGDVLASDLNQVLRRHLSNAHIVSPDKMRSQVGKVPVEEQIWRPFVAKFIEIAQIGLAGGDQQDIHAAAQEGANLLPLHLRIFF